LHETWESYRPDAQGKFVVTCNAMEHSKAREIMPLVEYIVHIVVWIEGKPALMLLLKKCLLLEL